MDHKAVEPKDLRGKAKTLGVVDPASNFKHATDSWSDSNIRRRTMADACSVFSVFVCRPAPGLLFVPSTQVYLHVDPLNHPDGG